MPRRNASSRTEAGAPSRLVGKLLLWFLANARDIPWRHTLNPYGIWVSEIMLQQTQVKTVIPFWNRWMKQLPTIQKLAKTCEPRVLKLWEGLGYYTRARNLQKAAKQIVEEHDGTFPTDLESILKLPGIGPYTAGAISSIAFNKPTPVVDGNIIRVVTRLHGIRDNPKDKSVNEHIWFIANILVATAARKRKSAFKNPAMQLAGPCSALNQSLMELGATICLPRRPKCDQCPLRNDCVARKQDCVDSIPNLGKRPASTARTFHTFVLRLGKRYFVRQRPESEVNGGFWEFPNIEVTDKNTPAGQSAQSLFAFIPGTIKSLGQIQHTITRYRITQCVFTSAIDSIALVESMAGRWCNRKELEKLPFVSAQRGIRL